MLCAEADTAIRRHGREAYPHECCGALIGREQLVVEALALPNATGEGSRRRFLVRPADYWVAERRAAELGAALLGFYHSHPMSEAFPSPTDVRHAVESGYSEVSRFLIVSLAALPAFGH